MRIGGAPPGGKACCSSCASGGPCAGGSQPPVPEAPKACCGSCARGGPCKGTSSVDRHFYDRGCRGVGEYAKHPAAIGEGTQCDNPESCYWPLHRQYKVTRAGLPTHKEVPELYEDDDMANGAAGRSGDNTLAPSRYRRIYHFEKEPYFFAKEYDDDFCRNHPTPWSEGGYYYYKDAHASKDHAGGWGNW